MGQHEAGVKPWVFYQKGRQAAEVGVYQPFHPPLRDIGQLCQGHRKEVHGQGHRLSVKVPASEYLPALRKEQGVISGRVHLRSCHLMGVPQGVS